MPVKTTCAHSLQLLHSGLSYLDAQGMQRVAGELCDDFDHICGPHAVGNPDITHR
jgi:hypothetical protein